MAADELPMGAFVGMADVPVIREAECTVQGEGCHDKVGGSELDIKGCPVKLQVITGV
jgi:hypothetical protein